jgi:hypothetical protein
VNLTLPTMRDAELALSQIQPLQMLAAAAAVSPRTSAVALHLT